MQAAGNIKPQQPADVSQLRIEMASQPPFKCGFYFSSESRPMQEALQLSIKVRFPGTSTRRGGAPSIHSMLLRLADTAEHGLKDHNSKKVETDLAAHCGLPHLIPSVIRARFSEVKSLSQGDLN